MGCFGGREFTQPDLNLYGIGHISPHGTLGSPSKASAEEGAKIVAEMKTNTLAWLRQRLVWLSESRAYSKPHPTAE